MFKYFTSTNMSVLHFPKMLTQNNSVVLSDTLAGNGVNYRMHSVIVGDEMDSEIWNIPYSREQRCKIFQQRNIQHMTLPFKVSHKNIKDIRFQNENYEGDFKNDSKRKELE